MWTYQEFTAKHAAKYSKLSVAEKRRRYQAYVASQGPVPTATGKTNNPRARQRNSRSRRNAIPGQILPFGPKNDALSRYLRLLRDPFNVDCVGLPVFPSPPSSKCTSWLKTTFAVGTNNLGYIMGRPAAASDVYTWHSSTATFTGNTLATATAAANQSGSVGTNAVTIYGQSNLPFIQSQYTGEGGALRQRLVCCAMRARYIGRQDTLGGNILPFVHPEHASIEFKPLSDLTAWEGVNSLPCSRQWITCSYVPVHRTELEFCHTTVTPTHDSVENTPGSYMCIAATGTTGNVYEVEIVCHHEMIGTTTQTKTDNNVVSSAEGIIGSLQNAVAFGSKTVAGATLAVGLGNLLLRR